MKKSEKYTIFISSVQKEFEPFRKNLKSFLLGDAVLRRFISEVFLFEEIPAGDRKADEVYLEEVARCDIYLGLFGYEYGYEDESGISPTEHEYDYATKKRKTRLVYVWGSDENQRHPKMKKLIRKASSDLIRRRVEDFSSLTSEVYNSLVDYLDSKGALRIPPFDTVGCNSATIKDLNRKRIDWFLQTAQRERGLSLKTGTATKALLTHLNLIEDNTPTNAAILLFGRNPQKYHRPAETKCIHCHGTEYRRPFASMQVYGGDLFEQADQARDFVLAKIVRTVGTRAETNVAPVTYEFPPGAVSEAIINAISHRDYNSHGSVEIRLFSDRLEVWNPGSLPGTLTFDSLRTDHASVPNNPLLAEPLYLARYIERVGSGTQEMIELCREAGLPEPSFEQRAGFFVTTFWRDWLTSKMIEKLNLNDRQKKGITYIKSHGRISNSEYQKTVSCIKKTATRDLKDLKEKDVLIQVGTSGPGVYYIFAPNGDKKGTIGT